MSPFMDTLGRSINDSLQTFILTQKESPQGTNPSNLCLLKITTAEDKNKNGMQHPYTLTCIVLT